MSSEDNKRIEIAYAQLKSLQVQPLKNKLEDSEQVIDEANRVIDELAEATGENFDSYKMTKILTPAKHRQYYPADTRSKLHSLLARLKVQYDFDKEPAKTVETPVIVQVNQTQQVSLTVTPITQLIEHASDDETKQILLDIKDAIEKKDEKRVTSLLKTIADKSFELFIRILPYLLEQWSKQVQ